MAIYNVAEYTGYIVISITSMHYYMVELHRKLHENTVAFYELCSRQ